MLPFLTGNAYVSLIIIHFMISLRMLALIMSASVFMLPSIPNTVKFWLSVSLSIVVTSVSGTSIPGLAMTSLPLMLLTAAREFLIGAVIGMAAGAPLYALQASGFIDGTLMGLNMMNTFDPTSQAQVSVLAQMKYMLAIWFYLHWDGHILLVRALVESVKFAPPGIPLGEIFEGVPLVDWAQKIFVLAMTISLPIFGSIILSEVGLGFVARTVPQLNVFILGIPLKIAIGMLVLLTVLPGAVDVFHREIEGAVSWALENAGFLR
ncbi:MAG: flagellar biosynthetic protein FliR [Synergistaceae bacterium]|jgi:flagellar biosynthetic protein FliR|nr:flagellar biosynthetic protein FliR [Synergistaceae bacterium]